MAALKRNRASSASLSRAARPPSCGVCKRAAAANPADGCGKALRLTTAFRYFECGASTASRPGRGCLVTGACRTFRSSAAMSIPRNAPQRPGTDERHTIEVAHISVVQVTAALPAAQACWSVAGQS